MTPSERKTLIESMDELDELDEKGSTDYSRIQQLETIINELLQKGS